MFTVGDGTLLPDGQSPVRSPARTLRLAAEAPHRFCGSFQPLITIKRVKGVFLTRGVGRDEAFTVDH